MGWTLRSLGSSLVALASLGTLAAGEPRLVRGPYLQALLSDSVKVLWFTDVPASGAVRFSEADGPGVAPRVVREGAPRTRHEVELSELRPRTTYRYEVLAGDAALAPSPGAPDSDEFQFRTAPPPGTGSFRAVAIGDSHQPGPGIDAVASLLEALAPDVDLFLHMGDFGPLRDIDELVFEKYRRLVRKTSFTAARGNHDFLSTAMWYEIFSPPDLRSEEIPPCGSMPAAACAESPPTGARVPTPRRGVFYSFDWGPAHFAVLDSNVSEGDFEECSVQLKWLCDDLEDARARNVPWLIIVVHHPTYTSGAYGPAPNSRNAFLDANRLLAPIADRFAVDLVFCGHDHSYQRSHPIRGGVVVDAWQDPRFVRPRGTVYVVTAGGGGILYGELAGSHHKKYMKLYRRAYHAVELEGSETELRLRARSPEGAILDEFSISKAGELPRPGFLRGDVDGGGDVALTDAIQILGILFLGAESACPGAYSTVGDADGTGAIDIADAVYLLNYLFLGGPPPGPPFERCEPLPDFDDAFCLRASCRL